jgi:PAS domain S-box-containing protein
LTEPERSTLLSSEIAAFTGLMRLKAGRWVSVFSAESATPRLWLREEIELIREVAERTWEAVERACAEEVIRDSEQRLRLALNASGAGSWMRDARTGRVGFDDRFREIYGFTTKEPASFGAWLSRVHEEDRGQVFGLLDQIEHTKTQGTFDSTYRIVRPDGTVSWVESLGQVHRDAEGQLMRLTGLVLDVTERRRAEEALQARRDEERNRTLQLLLETAPQGILSTDAQGVIVTANRALEKTFGWAVGELIGQSVEQLVPPPLQDRHTADPASCFREPQARLMAVANLVGKRKDGSTFPIEISLSHAATAAGGHAIAFVTDISESTRRPSTGVMPNYNDGHFN